MDEKTQKVCFANRLTARDPSSNNEQRGSTTSHPLIAERYRGVRRGSRQGHRYKRPRLEPRAEVVHRPAEARPAHGNTFRGETEVGEKTKDPRKKEGGRGEGETKSRTQS